MESYGVVIKKENFYSCCSIDDFGDVALHCLDYIHNVQHAMNQTSKNFQVVADDREVPMISIQAKVKIEKSVHSLRFSDYPKYEPNHTRQSWHAKQYMTTETQFSR